MTRNVLHYGSELDLPVRQILRAGPLSVSYEAGALRRLRAGTVEVVRQIYAAVRDRNWRTIPGLISGEKIESRSDSFEISYRSEHLEDGIHFAWNAHILGKPDGTIFFEMDGAAGSSFLKNRIGVCVLHPIRECAGKHCKIYTADRGIIDTVFPLEIAAHRPFQNIHAIIHHPAPGLSVQIRFEGDEFETEDQRNWTDSSFKTYSTPVSRPFPVQIHSGDKVRQSVSVAVDGIQALARDQSSEPALTIGEKTEKRIPPIGLGLASDGVPLAESELSRLKKLRVAHLRADLHLCNPDWLHVLSRAARESKALSTALELALFVPAHPESQLRMLRAECNRLEVNIARWLVLPPEALPLTREHLAGISPNAGFGTGTDADFYELNTSPRAWDAADFLSYSMSPQVHAFDNESLFETLETQGTTVTNAIDISRGLPIVVSPVTLKPRFNAVATGADAPILPGELPKEVDPRQMSMFTAAWMVGSLQSLIQAGAHSLTYFETAGWRGLMERDTGSPLPSKFRSIPGSVFPVYHVLAAVGEFRGGTLRNTQSSDALAFQGFAAEYQGVTRILLANYRLEPQTIRVSGLSAASARMTMLGGMNAFEATPIAISPDRGAFPVTLPPYAVARIDVGPNHVGPNQ